MEDIKVSAGDIVIAAFRFAESDEKKLRPCLVMDINAVSVELVCITVVSRMIG